MKPSVFILLSSALFISACDKPATEHNLQLAHTPSDNPHDLKALADTLDTDTTDQETTIKPIMTADGKLQIDWAYIDTKEPKADLTNYVYPIALESQAVTNYADAYHISPKQAQHSIVVAMAAPEALGKILDQLTGKYLGHHISDGDNVTLTIYTTSDVLPQKHNYIFADNFGKGLELPIIITPKPSRQ